MGDGPVTGIVHFLHLVITLLILIFFLILIAVICATIIPQLYEIDTGTDRIIHVETGTDRIPHVEGGVGTLHEDLGTMIGQLNLFASVLLSVDKNIANVCNGNSCTAFTMPAEAQ